MTTIELPEIRSSARNSFSYTGQREGWHIALSVNRDSEALERSNWQIITESVLAIPNDPMLHIDPEVARIGGKPIPHLERPDCFTRWGAKCEPLDDLADAAIERMSHFLVGWVDYLLVRPGSSAEKRALEFREKLLDYPIADEEHFSQLEFNEEWCRRCDSATREQHPTTRCGKFRSKEDAQEIQYRWRNRP